MKRSYRKYKISCFYSFGLLVPYLSFLLIGGIQLGYNYLIYQHTKTSVELCNKLVDLQNGINSLEYAVSDIHTILDRYIIEAGGLGLEFQERVGFEIWKEIGSTQRTRETLGTLLKDYMYNQKGMKQFESLSYLYNSPCLYANPPKQSFKAPDWHIPLTLCEKMSEGLAKQSASKTITWVLSQEKLIIEKVKTTNSDALVDIFKTRLYLDHEIYLKLVLSKFIQTLRLKLLEDFNEFNEGASVVITRYSITGAVFCSIMLMITSLIFHSKTVQLNYGSMYLVRLIPFESLSENSYVKSKLLRKIGLSTY